MNPTERAKQIGNLFTTSNYRWFDFAAFHGQGIYKAQVMNQLAYAIGDEQPSHVDARSSDEALERDASDRLVSGEMTLSVFSQSFIAVAETHLEDLTANVTVWSRSSLQQISIVKAPFSSSPQEPATGLLIVELRYPDENRLVRLGGELSTTTNQQSLAGLLPSLHEDLLTNA